MLLTGGVPASSIVVNLHETTGDQGTQAEPMHQDFMRATRGQLRTRLSSFPLILLACAIAGTAAAHAADEGAISTDAAQPVTHAADQGAEATDAPLPASGAQVIPRAHTRPRARDPAVAFAKHLDLDPKQQAQVSRLLAIRKEQIRRVWSNPAIAADDRVGAVKAINDKTMAQIRALLTEEQKAKYIQPRPAGIPTTEPQPSVQDWLNASRTRSSDASPP